jgi:hypothetical protein
LRSGIATGRNAHKPSKSYSVDSLVVASADAAVEKLDVTKKTHIIEAQTKSLAWRYLSDW